MKNEIIENLDNPEALEKLYQSNKTAFKHSFNSLSDKLGNSILAQYWSARLNYTPHSVAIKTNSSDLIFVLIASFVAGFLINVPKIFSLNVEFYYSRNVGFIVFPILIAYFSWKNKLATKQMVIYACLLAAMCLYINLLPKITPSDTILLACLHLPFVLWGILGSAFVKSLFSDLQKRIIFLKYNGELIIISAIILMAGSALTAITLGLFSAAQIDIKDFYFDNIAIWGLASTPIVGTYLVMNNPQLVSKVSPIIAQVFSPLVLIMLLIYLATIIPSYNNLYNDRNFLLVFNLLLIGVLAIILFSVIEHSNTHSKLNTYIIALLAIITIVLNLIALSAILFRISTWGFTPNRLAVLGSNFLMLVHLFLVSLKLLRAIKQKSDFSEVEKGIASFIPVYVAWASIVSFIFPVMFQLK